MGVLEPEWVFGEEVYPPEWECLDCGSRWTPEGVWEPDGDEFGSYIVFVPQDESCPGCGGQDTDEVQDVSPTAADGVPQRGSGQRQVPYQEE